MTPQIPHDSPPSQIDNYDDLQQDADLNIVPMAFKRGAKELGATARDHVAMPLGAIRFLDKYNVRTINERYRQRVEHLARLMVANGYQQDKPITGFITEENGSPVAYVVAGHTRVRAARRANEMGASIEFIPMLSVPKGANEIDLQFDIQLSNDSSPLALYELGVVCQRLINCGVGIPDIARRMNFSETHIRNALDLRSAPRSIVEHVSDGRISESLALDLMRQHGNAAIQMIESGVQTAKSLGKSKVTSAIVRGPKLPAPLGVSAITTLETLMQSIDNELVARLRETEIEGYDEADPVDASDAMATVTLPLAVVRQLLEVTENVAKAREKIAQKEARAKALAQSQSEQANDKDSEADEENG